MVRVHCTRSGWGRVRDPATDEYIQLDADMDPTVAERLVEEYGPIELADAEPDESASMEYEERKVHAETLVAEHWQSIVSAVESGDADPFLEELEREERRRDSPRQSILTAIEERRS